MNDNAFEEFRASSDTLRVYKGERLLFSSDKERLLPLVDYIDNCAPYETDVTVFDRVVGNAAALLLPRISCSEIQGELGSQLAEETLRQFGIRYRFAEKVPHIENDRRQGMCPMEELALNKTSDEFYQALRERLSGNSGHGGSHGSQNG